jgi:hypothetical protein
MKHFFVGGVAARSSIAVSLIMLVCVLMWMMGAASATTLCLQLKANGGVKGPTTVGGSTCKTGYEAIELPSANELEILKHATYESAGVGGKPTVVFSRVNLQIESGGGKEEDINGAGNLIVGYDEFSGTQTGSNNLVVGTEDQEYTSFGGLLAGRDDALAGPFSSVSGGYDNTASEEDTSVSGGYDNKASDNFASVSGGNDNTASYYRASVSGGEKNTASGLDSSVSGGYGNTASGEYSSVFGGKDLTASGTYEYKP